MNIYLSELVFTDNNMDSVKLLDYSTRKVVSRVRSEQNFRHIQNPFKRLYESKDTPKLRASLHTKKTYFKQIFRRRLDVANESVKDLKNPPTVCKVTFDSKSPHDCKSVFHASRIMLKKSIFKERSEGNLSKMLRHKKRPEKTSSCLPPISSNFDVTFGYYK